MKEPKATKRPNVSVKNNFLYQSIYQVLAILLPLITTPYVSRILGQDGIGVYSYTNTIVYFFLMAANLGISNYANREIGCVAQDREKLSLTFWGIYWCHAAVSLICMVGYVGFVIIFRQRYQVEFICQSFQLLAALFDITWLFFGVQDFKASVWKNIVVRVLAMILIFTCVKTQNDVWKYILVMAGSSFAGQIAMWTQINRYVDFVHVKSKDVLMHIKPLSILFIPIIGISIYRYMDKAMIPVFSSIGQLGLYENSEKIMSIPLSLITSFGIVLLPKISGLVAESGKAKSVQYFEKVINYELLLAVAMSCGLIGIAPVLAPVFLGPEFVGCSQLITGIAITIIFITWSNAIRSQYLIPNKKDRAFIVATFSGAAINFILNIILISKQNAMGAVIATVVTEFVVAIIHSMYSYKDINYRTILRDNSFYLIPGITMVVIVRLIGRICSKTWITLFLQMAVGVIVYMLPAIGYLYFRKDRYVRELIAKIETVVLRWVYKCIK